VKKRGRRLGSFLHRYAEYSLHSPNGADLLLAELDNEGEGVAWGVGGVCGAGEGTGAGAGVEGARFFGVY